MITSGERIPGRESDKIKDIQEDAYAGMYRAFEKSVSRWVN